AVWSAQDEGFSLGPRIASKLPGIVPYLHDRTIPGVPKIRSGDRESHPEEPDTSIGITHSGNRRLHSCRAGTGDLYSLSDLPRHCCSQEPAIPDTAVACDGVPEDPDIITGIHQDERALIQAVGRSQQLGLAGQIAGGYGYRPDLTLSCCADL